MSICNDTSFSHLSAALELETIILFADTATLYGSYNSKMHPIKPDHNEYKNKKLLPREKIPVKFNRWSNIWDRWSLELKEKKLNPIEACLSYPMSLSEVDHIVVGVNNLDQLKKLIKLSKSKISTSDLSFMISNEKKLINPTNWNSL